MTAPDQATSDELSTLYLRNRDTPCPNCNYNRRNGTTATCPECGTPIQFTTVDSQQHLCHKRLIELVLLFIWLGAILKIVHLIFSTIYILKLVSITQNGNPHRYEITSTFIEYVFWITILVLAFIRWRKVRRKQPIQDRAVISLLIALIVQQCAWLIYWIIFMQF